ncbi:sickle tail protein homolog isoform X5 [Osmerus eperlanus]|uniref:sickle tail protein homolog isoform X5 n=1 Tax=Osmerus eperlanus TaxID=29151 RepID=UPI002E0F869B
MSKASRLARPSSSGTSSKLPSPRKESPAGGGGVVVAAGRARVVSVGEKLMRAGSDGGGGGGGTRLKAPASASPATSASPAPQEKRQTQNQNQNQTQNQTQGMDVLPPRSRISPPKASAHTQAPMHKQTKSNLKVTSPEDGEHLSRRQASPNGTPSRSHTPASASSAPAADPKASSRTVPRRHTVGGARSSRDILAMQPPDMDKKREAFLEHLKQKYPHHASAIMGHQERLREQSLQNMLSSLHTELDIQKYLLKIQSPDRGRSPKHGPSPVPGVGEQAEHLSLASIESLDTMSEADSPSAFTRGSRSRASLPVVRSTNQTKDRSLGVLYLQYGDETKQIRMPNEITSSDTVRALFVSAFPQQLTMKMLESPSVAVYVKDDMRNVYYELTDVRNITDHSCLKVYHKDPAQAFSHGPRPTNGDARMHREMMYASREVQHPLRQPPMGPPPIHPMQGAMSPTTPHSLPPSPSRIPFGPRQGPLPASATIPRDRIATATPPGRSVSPCPSAILERRDVKPDDDMGGGKSHSLARGNEGLYADPYLLHEGRMSLASAHVGHPPPGESPEHGLGGYHRSSIRSTGSYSGPSPTDTMDHPALYRQKSRNSQLPTLGSKTPPPSPHRMTEVRVIDIHGGPPPHGVVPPPHATHMERSSPVRQSFRKEEVAKSRSNMGSPVVVDLQGHGPIPPASDPQTRQRMKAMEQQIASLTGLVQHALLKSPNSSVTEEPLSERSMKTASPSHSSHNAGDSPVLAIRSVVAAVPSDVVPAPASANLLQVRRNVSDLRQQLQLMRQQQLQNQEALRAQLKRAEQEISSKLEEAMRRLEDPVHRQRVLVEDDRHKYLSLEERVQTQLSELEQYVDSLNRENSVAGGSRAVTLKDVEEGAVSLRRVGESLAGLKGEFPALQTRMRAVLRVEVEAVKFLKEEPHKLDSMLKRVKSLTEVLSGLRRYSTEGQHKAPDSALSAPAKPAPLVILPPAAVQTDAPVDAPPPQAATKPGSPSALPEPQTSTVRSEVMPASPVVIHHVQSSPVLMQQSQQSAALTHQPSPPPTPSSTPTHGGLDSPGPGKSRVSPSLSTSDPPSPAPQHKKTQHGNPEQPVPANGNGNANGSQSLFIEELHTSRDKSKNRAVSIQAAEKEWEERRQNMGHYDGKEFEKILQEAQANMMKGIPSLEVGSEGETSLTAHPAAPGDQADSPQPVEPDTVEDPKPEPTTDIPAKPGPEKLPKPVLEKSSKTATTEQAPNPATGDGPTTKPTTAAPATDKVSKQGAEKVSKSPPPPPPRKTFPSPLPSGMTTTRSGEVVYTSRKESISAQEGEDEGQTPTPPPKPTKVPPEIKPKPSTPPPIAVSAVREEEDEGDKIMAELQSSEPTREDKDPGTDENGNSTVRQSPGVIYYVTGQISKEQPTAPAPPGPEEAPESREPQPLSTSQVSNVNPNDNSPRPQQPPQSPSQTGPPISPKPVGLNGFFPVPQKLSKRPDALKKNLVKNPGSPATSVVLSPINVEKRVELSLVQGVRSTSKIVMPATGPQVPPTAVKAAKSAEVLREKVVCEKVQSTMRCDEGDEASLSADLPGEEAPPPPDNIAFMITNTNVQALTRVEYQELVNAKKGSVRTVTVGNREGGGTSRDGHNSAPQDNGFGNKKPVIIIFNEPMDIRSAYKRLSTVFECEEEMERMLAQEGIAEESEESDTERSSGGVDRSKGGTEGGDGAVGKKSSQVTSLQSGMSHSSSSSSLELTGGDGKTDGKKKFKFKFPKKQFAALSQALRSGTKSGKKTLQVVVYEDEEESDGTVRQHKEAKRFEITRSKSSVSTDSHTGPTPAKKDPVESNCRSDDIRKSTYKTLDSLEQTIRQLETTISEMGPHAAEEPAPASVTEAPKTVGSGLQRSFSLPSSSKGPGLKANMASLKKKSRPALLPRPAIIPTATVTPVATQQNASVASPTSRMPVPMSAKSRQSPTDKAGKQQKLQDAQRQFRQANGSAKRVGGDHKTTSPTASKIPAFYPSSAKGSSQSAPNSDATNPINPSPTLSPSSSTTTKSSIPSPLTPRSGSTPSSSHIPSLSNGSLKLPAPHSHTGKALSFSSQTPNGRVPSSSSFSSSSSSSSPSPLSPTPLGPGAKSIRTIHTPSFTSYRPHHGSNGKSCIPTATTAKDST